eukprot:TRINITY_DN12885_c0_g1_i1.p1 TRINITY_DN12885_c0_g1~~TRINITY_DN12885_c0_g1_i1.p1  ORF type:complete len:268 (+),score=49.27 TRINITY_DN12885_c0_g1_i1:716-1519(+)
MWQVMRLHASFTNRHMVQVRYIVVAAAHIIYFVFYRIMFAEVSSPAVFAALALWAAAMEVVAYILLLTKRARMIRSSILEHLGSCCGFSSGMAEMGQEMLARGEVPEGMQAQEWAEVRERAELFTSTSVEYMLRHLANCASITLYLTVAGCYRLKWVWPHYTDLYREDTALIYIAISLGVDLLLIAIVTLVWNVVFGRSLWSHWWGFLKRPRFAHFWILLIIVTHVGTDLVVASYQSPQEMCAMLNMTTTIGFSGRVLNCTMYNLPA